MLAISTAWNYKEDLDPARTLKDIKKTGLDAIELGYRLRHDQLEPMIALVPEMKMTVASVHSFCPVPSDKPSPRHPSNHYRLSALDESERQSAVQWTRAAIDTAVRTGAKAVVIHAGMVETVHDISRQLIEMYKLGRNILPEFADMRAQLIKEREAAKGPFMDQVIKSIREFMPYAQEKNIKIGLETRYYPFEIPNHQEIGELLGLFEKQGMGYWHDMGHAEVNARLGLTPHMDYLNTYKDKLIGFHVHGVKILRDHHAPFAGDFDISLCFPFMKGRINVIESHHYASSGDIKKAVKKLREVLG